MLCLLKWRSYRLGGWGSNRVLNLKGDKKIRGKKGKGKFLEKQGFKKYRKKCLYKVPSIPVYDIKAFVGMGFKDYVTTVQN